MSRDLKKLGEATEKDLDRIQDAVGNALRSLGSMLDDAALITVDLTSVAKRVAHPLQKPYTGYIVVGSSAGEVVYTLASEQPSKYLRLASTGPVSVTLMVF